MEVTPSPALVRLADTSQVGETRRAAVRMAEQLNLGSECANSIALIATELATNILKHAKEGQIILQPLANDGPRGLRLLAIDKGPGIGDVSAALTDGWSTTTTIGAGLGTMRRMSDAFDIYSKSGAGTVVLCDFLNPGSNGHRAGAIDWGCVSVPYRGEELNGDGHVVKNSPEQVLILVVDGLGHGALASDAAREAERIVSESESYSPLTLIQDSHGALEKTRGAAMAIAHLSRDRGIVIYGGVGNIAGSISTAETSRGLASHNGTVGHTMQKVQEFNYPWSAESLLIMHSDGLSARWNLDRYPGLRVKHPAIIAAVLYRDFGRAHDDCTVLVVRNRAESQ